MNNLSKLPTWADTHRICAGGGTPRGSRAKFEFDPSMARSLGKAAACRAHLPL